MRLLKLYLSLHPSSCFAELVSEGLLQNTFCPNEGELHPWSTWPTFHRGVSNSLHGINFINQDIQHTNSLYPPIWDILNSYGVTTGIFGSLQSYPPSTSPLSLFYLPDTFSPSPYAYPQSLELFQKFNLSLVSRSKAVSGSLHLSDLYNFLRLVFNNSFSFTSLFRVFQQLSFERFSPREAVKRSVYQSVLGFDLYYKNLISYQPQFSTYFTNHLAGVMHRYWAHLFPEDFSGNFKVDKFYSDLIFFALDVTDNHLRRLKRLCDRLDYNLLVVSSMGQDSVDRGCYYPEYFLDDPALFLHALSLHPSKYNVLLSMQPDIIVECSSFSARDDLLTSIQSLTDSCLNPIIRNRYSNQSLRLNLSLITSSAEDAKDTLIYNSSAFHPSSFGLRLITRHPGTAYHIPEGISLAYGSHLCDIMKVFGTSKIQTVDFKDVILQYYGK